MRYERFYQYTKNWHRINVADQHDLNSLIQWCHTHTSVRAFHICTEDRVPYRKIENRKGYQHQFRFESEEDAMLFALTWCGEAAA